MKNDVFYYDRFNLVTNFKTFVQTSSFGFGKGQGGQGMGPGRGQGMGQGTGRPGGTTGKGYHVLPAKSGRGAKLPVVPGTVPANTGTFGRLFGGKSDSLGGFNNQPQTSRSAMGNRVGNWMSGQQSRSLEADYYMDGQGVPGNQRSQLETVVEAGRGVRKLPAQPGAGQLGGNQMGGGMNTIPVQNQSNLSVGQMGASNQMGQVGTHQPNVTSHNIQSGMGMGGQNAPNRFGIAGTAVTALQCMQPGAPNGSAVNVVHNPGVMQMDNGYGPQSNMMDMGGNNQYQAEVHGVPQQQQVQQHPSVQFAQPEWT